MIKATRSAYREAVFLEFVHLEGMSFLICTKAVYVLVDGLVAAKKTKTETNIKTSKH